MTSRDASGGRHGAGGRLAAIASFLVVVGCQSKREAVAKENLDAEEFCNLVMGAALRNLQATCSDAEMSGGEWGPYGYVSRLAKERVSDCVRWIEDDVRQGRLLLPAKAANACAAALDKQSWKDLVQMRSVATIAECHGLLVGTQKDGQPCRSDGTCAPGSFCSAARDGKEGRCKALAKAKQRCEARSGIGMGWATRSTCAEGLHCATAALTRDDPLGYELDIELGRGDPSAGKVDWPEIGLGNIKRRERGTARVRMGAISVNGPLAPNVIQRTVWQRQHVVHFRSCYEMTRSDKTKLEGRVAVRFAIARDGSVSHAADGDSDAALASVLECVQARFSKLKFPPRDAGDVTVTFPILFEPPEGAAAPVCMPLPHSCQDDGDCAGVVNCRAGTCSDDLASSGSKCDDNTDCGPGLYCKLKADEWEGRCAPRKKNGEACSHSLQCTGVCGGGNKCMSFCDGR